MCDGWFDLYKVKVLCCNLWFCFMDDKLWMNNKWGMDIVVVMGWDVFLGWIDGECWLLDE